MSPLNDPSPLETRQAETGPALRLVATYAGFSFLWIFLSDEAVVLLFSDPGKILLANTLKGRLFVAVTSLLLFVLIQRLIRQIRLAALREREALSESHRSHMLLATIADSSSDSIFAKDRQGRYLLFNREAGRVTGKPPEQMLGQDDSVIFPYSQAELIRAHDHRVMAENRTDTYEETLSTTDGERVFQATKGPLRNDQNEIIGVFGISRDITERKRAEETLRRSEASFRSLFEDNASVMLLIDPESGDIVDANRAATNFYGYAEDRLTGMNIGEINMLPPEHVQEERRQAASCERKIFYFPHRLASGEVRDVEVHTTRINREDRPLILSIIHDITRRKQIEQALRESEERLRLAMAASNQGWFDLDLESGNITVSPEYVLMLGYSPDEFQSNLKLWLENIHPEDRDSVASALQACAEDDEPCTMEYRRRTKSGPWRWLRSTGKIVQRNAQGKAIRMIGIHTDITERKEMEDQIRQLAFFDPLTGLPNRRLLIDRLNRAMATSKRSGRYCAAMFADLDNFKPLNDMHGHDAGDLLLIEVAERMKNCTREMDTVARFGGDEFVIMICELDTNKAESATQAGAVAEKIRMALAMPYVITIQSEDGSTKTIEHRCSASIGIALFINHEASQSEILKEADHAMYAAKMAGRNMIRFYDAVT